MPFGFILSEVLGSINQLKTRAMQGPWTKQIDQAGVALDFGLQLDSFMMLARPGPVLDRSGQHKAPVERALILVGWKVNEGGLVGSKVVAARKA